MSKAKKKPSPKTPKEQGPEQELRRDADGKIVLVDKVIIEIIVWSHEITIPR